MLPFYHKRARTLACECNPLPVITLFSHLFVSLLPVPLISSILLMARRTHRTPCQPQNVANHTNSAFPDATDVNTTGTTLQHAIAEDPTIGRELPSQPKGASSTSLSEPSHY